MDTDTIVAQATAPGVGAIAMIRISGPQSSAVLHRLAPDRPLPAVREATLVELRDPDDREFLDRAVVLRMEAPASYTGEDMVEISCHGGWLTPPLVLDACVRAGARLAEPGEFTRRAYLRGKLDLVQAEAVADLIEARSRALRRAAIHQVERGLSGRIAALRAELVRLEAHLVHHIDFPEEDDAPVPVGEIARQASGLVGSLDELLATGAEGELLREGALAVLAGRPNAGKSSLFNALLGVERAIVTEIPGTTRDAIEATVQLGGFPFRLIDTAGLRASDDRVEQLGIEVAERYVGAADVMLYCVDSSEGMVQEDIDFLAARGDGPVIVVWTKSDEGELRDLGDVGDVEVDATGTVSAHTGAGLGALRAMLPTFAYSELVRLEEDAPVLTRARQTRQVRAARDEVAAFGEALEQGLPPEVASAHLRSAETALEEVLGVVSVEDVLDAVFREFCVGK